MNRLRAILLVSAPLLAGAIAFPAAAQMPPRPSSGNPIPSGPSSSSSNFAQTAPNPVSPQSTAAGNFAPSDAGGGTGIDPGTVRRSEQQATGNYGSMDRQLGMPLGMTQDAWRNPRAHMAQGQVAPGVIHFRWSPDLVMSVRTRDFMMTTIQFPTWEHITEVFIGDQYYMQAKIVGSNRVLLRSSQSGTDTTVTAMSASGNAYTFYVRSEGSNTQSITDLMVFVDAPQPTGGGWTNGTTGDVGSTGSGGASGMNNTSFAPGTPGPTLDGGTVHPVSNHTNDMLVPRDKMIFNMRMFEVHPGDREIAPDYVYTDGVFTYFNFGTRARSVDRPVVLRVVDGIENRVNTRTTGRFGEVVVAEAQGDFVLKNGQKAICAKRVSDAVARQ